MTTKQLNKKLVSFLLIMLVCQIMGWALYKIFGHQLIEAMYEGRSIGILNRLIEGQSTNPLAYYIKRGDMLFSTILFYLTFFFVMLFSFAILKKRLEIHTDIIDALPDSYIAPLIALAAGLGLYAELMIIRIHSSYFQLFSYFKNFSLLSCFLGLGIGYARSSKRPLSTPLILPYLVCQIIFMHMLRFASVAELLQNPISEQLGFGIGQARDVCNILFTYAFLSLTFIFNTLCFITLGHLASRLMMRKQRLVSYSWNLLGSLIGILVFSFVSFIWSPPYIWIALAAVALLPFIYKDMISLLTWAFVLVVALVYITVPFHLDEFDVYSPYQILTLKFSKDAPLVLKASNTYYQKILDLSEKNIGNNKLFKEWHDYYIFPYYFKPKPEHVLIVGSGTGNDVAAALRSGAAKIDAVEIDPAILRFGEQLHPESPYQANNVNIIINDARSFIRETNKRYDMIVYGLLDSHTLLSGLSGGIRLDSYVYTVEGFREARKKLKDDGVISLTFCIISPELGHKLFLMLQEAFDGQSPVVFQTGYDGGCTFLIGKEVKKDFSDSSVVFKDVTARFADTKIRADKSTDDWPFFYMPIRKYPISYIIMILLLLIISTAFIRKFIPGQVNSFSFSCFFLGAGFMLLETKAITELALVCGSTWVIVSIVITAILIMAFFANLIVLKGRCPSSYVTYGLLFIALITNLGLTFINLVSLSPWLSRIIMTTVMTLPIFFSGLAFSTEVRKSVSIGTALSSNILGAMLGGFLEYSSMYFGFRSLYFLALIMYGFAFLGSLQTKQKLSN